MTRGNDACLSPWRSAGGGDLLRSATTIDRVPVGVLRYPPIDHVLVPASWSTRVVSAWEGTTPEGLDQELGRLGAAISGGPPLPRAPLRRRGERGRPHLRRREHHRAVQPRDPAPPREVRGGRPRARARPVRPGAAPGRPSPRGAAGGARTPPPAPPAGGGSCGPQGADPGRPARGHARPFPADSHPPFPTTPPRAMLAA